MANETFQKIGETTEPVAINLVSYTECMRFIVSPLKYSVILGKKWETKHQGKIDCENNQICFEHQGHDHVLHACSTIEENSSGSLINDYEKDFPMHSVLLCNPVANNSQCSPARETGITAILSEYSDVFPEHLTRGLPPKRTDDDSRIELKEGTKPIKKGLYRMSQTELGEVKKQVEELLHMGFVRPNKIPCDS